MATTKYQGFPTYRYAQIALKGSKKINQNRHYIESNPEEEQKPVSKEFHHSESGDNMRRRNKTGHTLANERPQQKQHQKKQQQQNAGSVSSKEELEVDYEHDVTELYQAISTSQWDFALETLKRNPHEARTWVVRYKEDDTKGIMWRFLPIHSACARQPPKPVIESLIQAYAKGAESCDDQGMVRFSIFQYLACSSKINWKSLEIQKYSSTALHRKLILCLFCHSNYYPPVPPSLCKWKPSIGGSTLATYPSLPPCCKH